METNEDDSASMKKETYVENSASVKKEQM